LKRIESARGADDEMLWAAQENSETFFFDRSMKPTDYRSVLGAPALREINCFENFLTRARF
jgi:hypothetical protein